MKKLLAAAVCLALLLSVSPRAAALEPAPEGAVAVSSPCAVLIEKETGGVIYEKNAHERGMPASVTKVMTMLLIAQAVDGGLISLDDMVTVSRTAASMGGSQIWLEEGEQMSVSDMLKCIAVVSANDCAVAMAEHIAGSESAFVQQMNECAALLGLPDTNFTNCTGLFDDPEHYTCAYDIAVMSRELLSHEWIKDYTTIWMDSVRNGEFGLSNTNKLVYYYDGCTGLKTGYTHSAMYCLSASAMRDGVEYIAVIMHGESIEKRNEDAKALLSYGFANYSLCPLRSGDALPPIRVELGAAQSIQPVYEGSAHILLPKKLADSVTYSMDISETLTAPVAQGQSVGTLTVRAGADTVAVVRLVSGDAVERLSVWGILSEMLKIALGAQSSPLST